jgi:hypothetical protein
VFPEILAAAADLPDVILDGEFVLFGGNASAACRAAQQSDLMPRRRRF